MTLLRYVKASDVEYDYCFLEIFKNDQKAPFMDLRISKDKQLSYCIYKTDVDIVLSSNEWNEVYEKGRIFLKQEIENEISFKNRNE